MRQRWYDPTLQRFISRDPIGLEGGANLYAYVRNNPQRWIDPTGLKICLKGSQRDIRRFLAMLAKLSCLSLELDAQDCIVVKGRNPGCEDKCNPKLTNEILNASGDGTPEYPIKVIGIDMRYMPSPGLYRDKRFKLTRDYHVIQMDVFGAIGEVVSPELLEGFVEHELAEAIDAVKRNRWDMNEGYPLSHRYATSKQHSVWNRRGIQGITDMTCRQEGVSRQLNIYFKDGKPRASVKDL